MLGFILGSNLGQGIIETDVAARKDELTAARAFMVVDCEARGNLRGSRSSVARGVLISADVEL